ncbi:MAG: D-alanine--D-alanine ligase [Planctomycetota bacterium]|nr:D-alanine--D-alanine ligase [Planctomycetota bacterium]
MRICLLTNQELDTVPFPADDWPCDPRPFVPDAEWTLCTLRDKHSSVAAVEAEIARGHDLFFNLCDGAEGQEIPGIEVVRTLERHGVAFTGATSDFYEPTRQQMKDACTSVGVATPRGLVASTVEDVERAAATLRFPLFVKHHNSYASVDISRRSRVRTPEGLRQQARKIMRKHGAALIEEYIDGVECAVLVAENATDPQDPITFVPVQYRFPRGEAFKHAKLKWQHYDGMECGPVTDPELDARLRQAGAAFFRALGGTSFGRCDVRVDRDGVPHMLEINPNCGVYYPPSDPGTADIILAHEPEGHAGFTRLLVETGLARARRAPEAGRVGDEEPSGSPA